MYVEYTAVALHGKAGSPYTGLTAAVGWMSLLQLDVLSHSAVVVQSKMLMAFLWHVSLCFLEFSVCVSAFVIGLGQIFSHGSIPSRVRSSGYRYFFSWINPFSGEIFWLSVFFLMDQSLLGWDLLAIGTYPKRHTLNKGRLFDPSIFNKFLWNKNIISFY